MKGSIRCELVTECGQLEGLAGEWDRLWNLSMRREIFTSFAWARASWRSYGGGRSLCTPVVFQGGKPVGILPVAAEGRTLRFLGSPGADYNDLLCAEGASAEILQAALSTLANLPTPWNECILENLSEHSQIVQHLHELSGPLRARVELSSSTACPTVVLGKERDQVLAGILGKRSLRRHRNRLERLGAVNFRHLEDREGIRLHLRRFFQQHVARRALAAQPSLFCQEDSRRFVEALVEGLDPQRELRFSVLELGDQPVAYHLGFELGGKFTWYKPTFDVNYWDYSPGEVMILRLFEYVATRDIHEVDFTGGDEPFKQRFANRVYRNYTLNFYRSGPRGDVLHLYHRAQRRLRERRIVFQTIKAKVEGLKGVFSRIREAARGRSFLTLTKAALVNTIRSFFFTHDELLVFVKEKDSFPCEREASGLLEGNIILGPGTLAELASLSVAHSDFLNGRRLREMRERLKRGDLVYIARRREKLEHLAWIGVRDEIRALPEMDPQFRVALEEPVSIIYEWWSPSAYRGEVHPGVLREVVTLAPTKPRQVWIYCRSSNLNSRRAIEKAGFHLQHRIRHLRLFRALRRTSFE